MEEGPFSPGLVLLAPGLVMLALNVAAATIVVGLATVVVERLSRRASVPLRHGMLCVALLLVLTSPALVWMAAQRNLGLVPIYVTSDDADDSDAPEDFSTMSPVSLPRMEGATQTENRPSADGDVALSGADDVVRALAVDPGSIDNPALNTVDLKLSFRRSRANRSLIAVTLSTAVRLFLFAWGVVGIWFVGRLVRGLFVLRRLQRSLRPSTDGRLIEAARQAFAAAGVSAVARLAESSLAPAPLTLGWRRAAIVVPEGLASVLTDEQLSCILSHEAAHVRRRDTLIALLQQLVAVAFGWNPFLHAINRRISRLRERLCDDFAATERRQGVALAQALVRVAEWSAARTAPSPMTSGLLADNSDLAERIERLTEADRTGASRPGRMSLVALGGFGVLLGAVFLFPMLRADEGESFELHEEIDDEFAHFEPAVERIVRETGDNVKVELSDPAPISVTGRVRSTEQKPVAGARVYLLSLHQLNQFYAANEPLAVTQTDAEGRYQFQNVMLPTIQGLQANVV